MFVRLWNGETHQVKPGTDILFIGFKLGDTHIQFISTTANRMIRFAVYEVEKIF